MHIPRNHFWKAFYDQKIHQVFSDDWELVRNTGIDMADVTGKRSAKYKEYLSYNDLQDSCGPDSYFLSCGRPYMKRMWHLRNYLKTSAASTKVIEYGHQIRTVYGRKQTVYDHIRLYLYRLRTVFCRKPDRWFTTVFQWKYCRILIVYRPYTAVFPLKYGRKSSVWFTGRIQCFTAVSAPYSSSWEISPVYCRTTKLWSTWYDKEIDWDWKKSLHPHPQNWSIWNVTACCGDFERSTFAWLEPWHERGSYCFDLSSINYKTHCFTNTFLFSVHHICAIF
jgi:hypothetical protein